MDITLSRLHLPYLQSPQIGGNGGITLLSPYISYEIGLGTTVSPRMSLRLAFGRE